MLSMREDVLAFLRQIKASLKKSFAASREPDLFLVHSYLYGEEPTRSTSTSAVHRLRRAGDFVCLHLAKDLLELPDHIKLAFEVLPDGFHQFVLVQAIVIDLPHEANASHIASSRLDLEAGILEEKIITHLPYQPLAILGGHRSQRLVVGIGKPDSAEDHDHVIVILRLNDGQMPARLGRKLGCNLIMEIFFRTHFFEQALFDEPCLDLIAGLFDILD